MDYDETCNVFALEEKSRKSSIKVIFNVLVILVEISIQENVCKICWVSIL